MASWRPPGNSWAAVGRRMACQTSPEALLGGAWVGLGDSWASLGASLGRLGALLVRLKLVLGRCSLPGRGAGGLREVIFAGFLGRPGREAKHDHVSHIQKLKGYVIVNQN